MTTRSLREDIAGGDQSECAIGPGKPPRHSRFKKGKSGNPRGRPVRPPLPHIVFWEELNKPISLQIDGETLKMSRLEAIYRQLGLMARKGNPKAVRLMDELTEKSRIRKARIYGEPKEDYPKYEWTEEHERMWLFLEAKTNEFLAEEPDDDDDDGGPKHSDGGGSRAAP